MTEKETLLLTAFARKDVPVDIPALVRRYGSISSLFTADQEQLRRDGIRKTVRSAIREAIRADLSQEEKRLSKHDIIPIPWCDPRYPKQLSPLPDKPNILFVRGTLTSLKNPAIAVVGTRRISLSGLHATRHITTTLAHARVTTISGLAFGADAVAHSTAIRVGGHTIAVLASGIDRETLGPRAHVGLADNIIASGGVLLSEYPPNLPGAKHRFPRRNRIIAGLSIATVVCEAPERSGALITAKAALDYGRDVFSVPGPMTDKRCLGTNTLIASGAIPVCTPETIIDYYGIPCERKIYSPSSRTTQAVLNAIQNEGKTIEEISHSTKLSTAIILTSISELELNSVISSTAGIYKIIDSQRLTPLP